MNYPKGISFNLILLVLLGVLSLFLFRPPNLKDLSLEIPEEIPLIQYNVADILAVALIHDDVRFGLIHKEGLISVEPAPPEALFAQERMQSFLYRLSKLTAVARVKSPRMDDDIYGLDQPRGQMTLILKDGSKTRLFLGGQNPLKDSWYCRKDGTEDVFLLSDEDAWLFLTVLSDFMTSQILPRVELKDLNTLEKISLSFQDSGNPSFSIENTGDFTFRLNSPVESTVDYETVLSALVFPILSLNPLGRAEQGISLPDTPDLILDVMIQGESYSLRIYRKEGNEVFLTSRGSDTVFVLAEESLPFLSLHYLDLMNDSIYHSNVSEIQSLVISDIENHLDYNIDLTGDSIKLQASVNGIQVDYPEMMDFFEILLQTGLARELPAGRALSGDDPLSLTVQIHKKNGNIDSLDFSPFTEEEGEQILFINGKADFIAYNKTVLDITNFLADLAHKDGD